MIEYPEAFTIAKQINDNLKGRIISNVEILHTPHRFAFFEGNVDEYNYMLEGQSITSACSHGGMIEVHTEKYMMFFADGAYPRYFESSNKIPKNRQFLLEFDDQSGISISIQMYGELGVYKIGTCDYEYYLAAVTRATALSENFTFEHFKSLIPSNGKKLTAKALIATEQRIPGIGNGVSQDILWRAGLDPRFDMREASESHIKALYNSIITLIKEMCDNGGRDTEKDLYNNAGGYITQLSKNSWQQPCMKCGTLISKASFMGGTVYFCEKCQKR